MGGSIFWVLYLLLAARISSVPGLCTSPYFTMVCVSGLSEFCLTRTFAIAELFWVVQYNFPMSNLWFNHIFKDSFTINFQGLEFSI